MSTQEFGAAFVEWVNSFEDLSAPISSLEDLSDGAILFEILSDIDGRWFKNARPTAETGDNWVLRVNNLKKIYRMLLQYYQEKLGQSADLLDDPDLTLIARDHDPAEIAKLAKIILAMAVQSENNAVYVQRVQGLSPRMQHQIMYGIEQVVNQLSAASNEDDEEYDQVDLPTQQPPTPQKFEFSETDEQVLRLRAELNRAKAEKEDLERVHRNLMHDHSNLRQDYDELCNEKDDLRVKNKEIERALNAASETGKGEFLLRTEIDALKQDLEKSETKLDEAEHQLEEQALTIAELNRRSEDLTRKAEQANKLKDQLQEFRHMHEKLQKAEANVEKYKKKLEEKSELQKQLKVLEEQNRLLAEKLSNTEDEYRKIMSLKPMLESYKDQVVQLTNRVNQTHIEKNKLEYDIRRYQEKLTLGELEKQRDQDQIQLLEERMRELEHGLTGVPIAATSTPSGTMRIQDAQSERQTFELKTKIAQLEREIDSLRHSRTEEGLDARVKLLESMLDDSNKVKVDVEQKFVNAQKQNMLLENELSRLRGGVDHDLSLSLRQRLNESEEKLTDLQKQLIEAEVALDESKKELIIAKSNLTLVDKDKIDVLNQIRTEAATDLEDLQRDHAALKMRLTELEGESQKQLEQLNQLLIEKDQLQTQIVSGKDVLLQKEREASEARAHSALLESREATETEQLKSQLATETRRNGRVQEQLTESQEQIRVLQVKMQKAKEFIRQQDRLFKETRKESESKGGTYEEAVGSLKAELKSKEDEVARWRGKFEESTKRWNREQSLMMSAWHDINRRMMRDGMARAANGIGSGVVAGGAGIGNAMSMSPGGSGGLSWLAQQRRMNDIQAKRKQ